MLCYIALLFALILHWWHVKIVCCTVALPPWHSALDYKRGKAYWCGKADASTCLAWQFV